MNSNLRIRLLHSYFKCSNLAKYQPIMQVYQTGNILRFKNFLVNYIPFPSGIYFFRSFVFSSWISLASWINTEMKYRSKKSSLTCLEFKYKRLCAVVTKLKECEMKFKMKGFFVKFTRSTCMSNFDSMLMC